MVKFTEHTTGKAYGVNKATVLYVKADSATLSTIVWALGSGGSFQVDMSVDDVLAALNA